MKVALGLFITMFFFQEMQVAASEADSSNYYKTELQNLLKLRKEKFDSYSQSLEQRSGIFGNKTKRDIKESNQVLIDIVRTDNQMIRVLNRVLDYRTFEKVSMNYDLKANQLAVNNLSQATDTLSKQVSVLRSDKEELEKSNYKLKALLLTLLCISVIALVWKLTNSLFSKKQASQK